MDNGTIALIISAVLGVLGALAGVYLKLFKSKLNEIAIILGDLTKALSDDKITPDELAKIISDVKMILSKDR